MFGIVLRFELRYQLRRPVTWLFFLVFFLLAFFSVASDAVLAVGATGQIKRNAPFILATVMGVLTAIGQVITTAIAGTAVLRDAEMGTQELLFTTRLTKAGYLLGRFAGAFATMLVVYAALPLGLLLGSMMPWIPADKLGPVSVWAIVQPFLVVAVPNLFFVCALFFAVGALTRKLFAVYIQGIALLTAWQITQTIIGSLDRLRLASLLDPFGITTVGVATRYWSVVEKNTRLVPLAGPVLENRLLWVALGIGLFAVAYVTFQLRLAGGTAKARRKKAAGASDAPAPAAAAVPAVTLRYDAGARWRMFLSQARYYFATIVKEAPFRAIMAIGIVNLLLAGWYASRPGDSVTWPVTATLAPLVMPALYLFLIILITLYAGELVWRERQLNADQIVDALPVPVGVTLVGKMAGLVLAMVLVVAVAAIAAMLLQLAQGYTRLEPGLYLTIVFGIGLPTIVQLVCLAFAVHALVNQKFVGHVVLIVYYVGIQIASTVGFDHRLYQYGRQPSFTYSDMNRFGPYVPRIAVLDGYYFGLGLVLVVCAYLLWIRGTVTSRRERLALARLRFGGGAKLALGGALGVTAAFGGIVFYNTNVLNAYSEVRTAERSAADAERTYKRLEPMAQPRIVGASVAMDLYPERRAAAWRGTLTAVNRSTAPVDTLYLRLPPTGPRPVSQFEAASQSGLTYDTLDVGRPATVLVDDVPNGVRLVRLATPLAPGDSLRLRFSGRYEPRGFPNDAFNNDVAANGSFMNSQYMPGFGYDPNAELSDDDVRRRNHLAPKPRMPSIDDPAARRNNYITVDADWIRFDATVSTSADQIAIAPGYLQKEWTEGGRRYFQYVMDKPVLDFYAFQSARYAVKKERYDGVDLEIYHHPWHTFALASMLQASKDGLDYFGTHFSPYQFRQYRIIEFPRYQSFAQAFPNTIPFSEAIGFVYRLEERDDAIDFAYFVTAHELAHQWWAHQVIGANAQGATAFSEGLAEYSALTVIERRYGREATQKFLRRELDTYLRGRGTERKKEVPYLYVENQAYIHYYKGSLVYYALRDYIGEAAMNRALSSFLAKWAFKDPPYPTARDLFTELKTVTPDSLQYVLTDLFETITLYDNKTVSATSTKRPDGTYQVSLTVQAKKLRADSLGTETTIPVADYVDIGIFGEKQKGNKLGEPLLVTKVRITQPETILEFTVPKAPRKAGIDPYNKLIDRTPEDNVADVVPK